MSAYPLPTQLPLTVSEYLALPEDSDNRFELVEGVLVMSPSPWAGHNRAITRVLNQLSPQLPDDLELIFDVDVDLELVPPDQPGTVRRPDVLVYSKAAWQRVREDRSCLRASDLVLTVEVISPSSRRTDRIVKLAEYCDAGVPYYWVVDLDEPASLLAYRRTEESGYVEDARVTGPFTTDQPFPVTVQLDDLV